MTAYVDPLSVHNPSSGATIPSAWGDAVNAAFTYLAAAWETYTPTITASGTAFAFGTTPTKIGRYQLVGKQCRVHVELNIGTTPTVGTGDYSFSLPATPHTDSGITFQAVGEGGMYDASASSPTLAVARIVSGAVKLYATGSATAFGAATPVIPATGDEYFFNIEFEVA